MPSILIDIKPPPKRVQRKEQVSALKRPGLKVWRPLKIFCYSLLAGIAVAAVFYGVGIYRFKMEALDSVSLIRDQFEEAKTALLNFEPKRAKVFFEKIGSEARGLSDTVERTGLAKIAALWGEFSSRVSALPRALKNLLVLSEAAASISDDLETLKTQAANWVVSKSGELLIARLENLKTNVSRTASSIAELKKDGAEIGMPLSDEYLGSVSKLLEHEELLTALLGWLKTEDDRHLLVAFQNPSEIRPAGGFMGSYADLTLHGGSLTNLKVWDVYDPDGQLDRRIVPPRALQGVTPTWGARDANWFFDFPTSARKIAEMLEASKIYMEQDKRFDGVIAVNVQVLQSILNIAGPITLPEYNLTLTGDSFLAEIQREVEAGRDKARGEPKRILKVLTPLLLERLGQFSGEEKRALILALKDHFAQKDIMVFFRDLVMQNYAQNLGVTGEVARLPNDFAGDYLAVVNANVAGGKSDAFVSQKIKLESRIEADGTIQNFLAVERSHEGGAVQEPWYRATNKNYMKIFTPFGSKLTYAAGNDVRIVKPSVNYLAGGYLFDADLEAIERGAEQLPNLNVERTQEFERTAFGMWSIVPAGTTKKIELQYQIPATLALNRKEIPYQFVFETQSGVHAALELFLEAPPGYIWKESNEAAFMFEENDPPARLELSLTLLPIP